MSDAVTRARELLAKATPGPWEADGLEGNLNSASGRVAEVLSWSDADAELIAAAPTLLAELADEVDRIAGACKLLGRITEQHGRALVAATRSQDVIDDDGDGDWQLVEERAYGHAPAVITDVMVERAMVAFQQKRWHTNMAGDALRADLTAALEAALGVES